MSEPIPLTPLDIGPKPGLPDVEENQDDDSSGAESQ